MRWHRRSGSLALGVLAVAVPLATAPAAVAVEPGAPVRLQPHRAVYDLSLEKTGAATSVASVNGRIVYELMGSTCEGYAQNMRFVTETTNTEGQGQVSDLRTSSFEDAAARRMKFSSSTYGNDQLVDQTQGVAAKTGNGTKTLAIDIAKPAKKKASIADEALFPIEHSMAIIRHARAGNRTFGANLYDGAEGGEKYYFTSSFIGPPSSGKVANTLAEVAKSDKLAGLASYPVSIAYFKPETRNLDAVPLYEMRFRFFDNGITADLMIDHGDYALKGELKELTLLDDNPCP